MPAMTNPVGMILLDKGWAGTVYLIKFSSFNIVP